MINADIIVFILATQNLSEMPLGAKHRESVTPIVTCPVTRRRSLLERSERAKRCEYLKKNGLT